MSKPANPWDLLLGALFGASTVMFVISKTDDPVAGDFMLWRSTIGLALALLLAARAWPTLWKRMKPDG